jgi:hypothetical protein
MSEIAALFGVSVQTLILFLIWSVLWKAGALWVSARSNEKWWFIVLLILNSMGLLEAIYLFWVKKGKWPKEVVVDRIQK